MEILVKVELKNSASTLNVQGVPLHHRDSAHISDMATLSELVLICAPLIHPITMHAVIKHESGGNPLALHDNLTNKSYRPKTLAEAQSTAKRLAENGGSVDIGLAQINSRNLPKLGLSIAQVLDPCENLKASQTILLAAWRQSSGDLSKTLSAYNTGKINSVVGFAYAKKVFAQAGVSIKPSNSTPAVSTSRDAAHSSLRPQGFSQKPSQPRDQAESP